MIATDTGPPTSLLEEIERAAVQLARLAGTEIQATLGRELAVRYKREAEGGAGPTDPVSEVDHQVEVLIRATLGERFPDHAVVGEEIDAGAPDTAAGGAAGEREFAWVVDPVDGTANFVNGFPLFAASVGVLRRGRPVVGALWCSTSHALRPGVYHAREGGRLRFEEEPLAAGRGAAVRRRLVGEPATRAGATHPWDVRVTGSAALECAFVAAGLLRAARFAAPNVWDVGGGLALVRAAGLEVRARIGGEGGWRPFERFEAPAGAGGLRAWRGSVAIGEPAALDLLCREGDG